MLTREEFQEKVRNGLRLLDGATGSNLRAVGMPKGCCTEQWVLENPEPLLALQRGYAQAGSQILYAPTFQAQPIALKAVESGVVDVLMFSINPAYDMERAETDIYDLMEFKGMEKNGLVVDEARQKLYTACETAGVAITVMKPLGAGTLLKAESSPFGVAMTVPQCIQYCLDRNGVKVVIVGCHTVEEVLEAVRYYDVPAAERSYAHIFGTGSAIHMTGRCMYCNHCQPCPAHIDIAAVTKFLDLATQQPTVPETVAQHYWSLSATADNCLMCGRCEPNCPFGVKIRENMKKAREVFAQTKG